MSSFLVADLPRHQYCYVDTAYTHREPCGFIPCIWFAVVSYPGRVYGCHILLESGALYRNVPLHALSFKPNGQAHWEPKDAQSWNCYGERFTVIEYKYLSNLSCLVKANGMQYQGRYLFSVVPYGNGFSAEPSQNKEFCFVALHNGRITAQPTNHIVFEERSFTEPALRFPTDLKLQTEIYSVED